MVYPTMPPKFSHAVCPEGGVYKATRLPASSVDSDSKLDLDDVAAGHPVAMRELAALREVVDRAKKCAPLSEAIYRAMASTRQAELSAAIEALSLLPAPGVAQEPFEEWHRRECPDVHPPKPISGPCFGDDAIEGTWRWMTEWGHGDRFKGRTCREVFQSEVAAKSGEGREAR